MKLRHYGLKRTAKNPGSILNQGKVEAKTHILFKIVEFGAMKQILLIDFKYQQQFNHADIWVIFQQF